MSNKTRLKLHLILVTKYRKPVLKEPLMNLIIETIRQEMTKRKCNIIAIKGDDQNHIHIMMEILPTHSVSFLVQIIKQYTRYRCWQEYPAFLRKTYWYKDYLWSSGYFCTSTGDVSSESVKHYIESQGD